MCVLLSNDIHVYSGESIFFAAVYTGTTLWTYMIHVYYYHYSDLLVYSNLYTSFYIYAKQKNPLKRLDLIFIAKFNVVFSYHHYILDLQLLNWTKSINWNSLQWPAFILAIIYNRNIIMCICQWSILETPSLLFKWNLCIHMIMPSCYIRVYNHMYAVMFLKGSYERKNINGM